MARPREPVELIMTKGKKHLTKAEIEERLNTEVKPVAEGLNPPSYLTAKQKKRFREIAAQLNALKIMGETDVDTLAHYITA
ncbi:MAG: phage terminase small subunit P27 family, partial [Oscillospiraceae bacterium]|nr:phage terminase small subunit P27 family [Oscillospiraceae bacterium]